jgi:hypothetical protein
MSVHRAGGVLLTSGWQVKGLAEDEQNAWAQAQLPWPECPRCLELARLGPLDPHTDLTACPPLACSDRDAQATKAVWTWLVPAMVQICEWIGVPIAPQWGPCLRRATSCFSACCSLALICSPWCLRSHLYVKARVCCLPFAVHIDFGDGVAVTDYQLAEALTLGGWGLKLIMLLRACFAVACGQLPPRSPSAPAWFFMPGLPPRCNLPPPPFPQPHPHPAPAPAFVLLEDWDPGKAPDPDLLALACAALDKEEVMGGLTAAFNKITRQSRAMVALAALTDHPRCPSVCWGGKHSCSRC